MFKLIKILNSAVNVPEPVRIATDGQTDITIGSALVISGGLATHCTATAKPLYIAAASAKGGEDESILAYPVFENMLFETVLIGSAAALSVGDKVTLSIGESGEADGVTSTTTAGVATIVDLQGASNSGDKITVKF